jgi:hypothetical protein
MATIKLIVKNVTDALSFKDQLKEMGLDHEKDYHWRFNPGINDWYNDENNRPASVEFNFIDESMATFFKLKWNRYE